MTEHTSTLECGGAPRDRANGRRTMLWSIGWAIATLLASAAQASKALSAGPVPAIAAGVAILWGVGTVWAYRRFLRETDELRRKIELEALAVALGLGVVGGLAYVQLSRAFGAGEPSLSYLVAGMLFTYSFSVAMGLRRYS